LDRLVAIKEFYPREYVHREDQTGRLTVSNSNADAYQRWLQRFEREGRILARLNHPGIVKVHSLFKERDTAYLVMELLAGQTLGDELEAQPDKRLSLDRLETVMMAIVSALEMVHREGVYHLDLKPDNVMVTQDGRIVLVDFGAARQDLSRHDSSSPAKKSTAAFTLEYAPPELIGGQPVSAASDLFELGMMLHEMLTGQRPETAWNRLLRDVWQPTDLVEPWGEMLAAALRLRSEERPQSVAEWWQTRCDFVSQQSIAPQQLIQSPIDKTEAQSAVIQRQPPIDSESATILKPMRPSVPPQTATYIQPQPPIPTQRQDIPPEPNIPPPVTVPPLSTPSQVVKPFKRRWLLFSGLGAMGLGGAWLLHQFGPKQVASVPEPMTTEPPTPTKSSLLPLKFLSFETVTVNDLGEIIDRVQKRTRIFTEKLANGVNLEMLEIPAGEFLMGSPDNELYRDASEGPRHRVTLRAFFMGRFTITQEQWQAVMESNPAHFPGKNYPVENISWNDAQEFCEKLSQQTGRTYRLPSQAEWEYACRAGTTTPFHFGPTLTTRLANYQGEYPYGAGPKGQHRKRTVPVGSFPANGFGLHEMHGNVWEWCEDIAHKNYQEAPTDGSAWVTEGDPDIRILRGGSWNISPGLCRAAFNNFPAKVTFRSIDHGLRVVLVEA
jgi:formylglycine-generating enzyme required for sulfatase activity